MDYDIEAEKFMERMFMQRPPHLFDDADFSIKGERAVMLLLWHNKGFSACAGEIATQLQISTARIAVVLKNLEQKQYIKKFVFKEDRRKIIVELTDLGLTKISTEHADMKQKTSNFFKYLGEDGTKQFINIIIKAKDYLEKNNV